MKSLQALVWRLPLIRCHYGHLKPVETLANLIGLTRVTIILIMFLRIVPSRNANSVQRKHMLELAIADKPLFTLDERELKRNAPLLHCANTERVAAGTRTGRAAGVYYWSGFTADLSDWYDTKRYSTMHI